ncbi:MAG: MBL fold metallo-hydrolase [Planctomycetota bacterium]
MSSHYVRMLNGRFGDPTLFISLDSKRSILFDCGDCQRLTRKELASIERVFITHTHMDHLFGFDRLLRVCIDSRETLEIYGPPGLRERLEHKFQGITHNLVVQRSLRIRITELHPNFAISAYYPYQTHFQREQEFQEELPFLSEILPEDTIRLKRSETLTRKLDFKDYQITYTSLLHVVPVLSYKLTLLQTEKFDQTKMAELGVQPGPWIQRVKESKEKDIPIEIEGKTYSSKFLYETLFQIAPQDAVGYVTDTLWHPKVERRIKEMMKEVKYFFCDSCYVEADMERAKLYYHLTTKQAGELAKSCKVEKLINFHFSMKYGKNYHQLVQEAQTVFSNVAPLEGIGENAFHF